MRKIVMVALLALVTLPVLAEQKKPTPTAVAKTKGDVKATPAPADTSLGGSKSNGLRQGDVEPTPKSAADQNADRIFCGDHTDTPRCCRHNGGYWVSLGPGDSGGCNFYYYYYRVMRVNVKDKSFTVMAKGKEFAFSGAKLKALPKVGDVIDITYTRTPNGPLEATTIKSSKSNTSE